MTPLPNRQKGAVLIVSLLLLIVATLLGVATINSSSVNLLIVNNMQEQQRAESAVIEAIGIAISNIETFNVPAEKTVTVKDLDSNVTVSAAQCLAKIPVDGYSSVWELVPEDTIWELTAAVTDPGGASASMTQGLRLRLPNGSCPD
jgi:Tfp pilus assembly protein PilX